MLVWHQALISMSMTLLHHTCILLSVSLLHVFASFTLCAHIHIFSKRSSEAVLIFPYGGICFLNVCSDLNSPLTLYFLPIRSNQFPTRWSTLLEKLFFSPNLILFDKISSQIIKDVVLWFWVYLTIQWWLKRKVIHSSAECAATSQ